MFSDIPAMFTIGLRSGQQPTKFRQSHGSDFTQRKVRFFEVPGKIMGISIGKNVVFMVVNDH